jgi:hypothetical protein
LSAQPRENPVGRGGAALARAKVVAREGLTLLVVIASACSASRPDRADGGSLSGALDGGGADARPGEADANRSGCPDGLPADLGAVAPLALDQNQTEEYYFVFASVSDEPDPVQQFAMRLYKDRGLFAGGVEPGSYTISGDQADYQWCDACVFFFAEKAELPYAMFMAQSGVIHLESVGAELTGTVEHLQMTMVDIPNDGGDCAGPGDEKCGNTSCIDNRCGRQVELGTCDFRIDSLSF